VSVHPRLVPARPDLAAAHLAGSVAAERYVEGEHRRVALPSAPLRRAPRPDAGIDTEALRGDAVVVYEETDEGWAWVQLGRDSYVGYVPREALGPPDPVPTHRVARLRTFLYPGAELKLPPLAALSIGAELAVAETIERRDLVYAVLPDGTAVVARHLVPVATVEQDWVAVAERFVGVPYLWGGATSLGVDCSGLVQLACRMAGIAAPRDTDMQEAGLGEPVPLDRARADRVRGDLLFWPGHVGIMLDGARLLHASGFHMEVVIEPAEDAVARIAAKGTALRTVRRLPPG
jgi:cell wall-associated NlpC family hydrolase